MTSYTFLCLFSDLCFPVEHGLMGNGLFAMTACYRWLHFPLLSFCLPPFAPHPQHQRTHYAPLTCTGNCSNNLKNTHQRMKWTMIYVGVETCAVSEVYKPEFMLSDRYWQSQTGFTFSFYRLEDTIQKNKISVEYKWKVSSVKFLEIRISTSVI